MALAEYHHRSAVAAAQILGGFDEAAFRSRLESERIELSFGADARRREGRHTLDLALRLAARLYPAISLRPRGKVDGLADELANLARSINPLIEVSTRPGTRVVSIGEDVPRPRRWNIYVGSNGPDAVLSTVDPQSVGDGDDPFGAGAAACFAMANLFRACFLEPAATDLDDHLVFSTVDLLSQQTSRSEGEARSVPVGTALVGVGAIGNGVIWGLGRAPLDGVVALVDPQELELSNIQRYVLTARSDEGRSKVDIGREALGAANAAAQPESWAEYVGRTGYDIPYAIVALDSAKDRRAVAASLPKITLNAWTQPGDLGVSRHDFVAGACLACLYLPTGASRNEDEIVAAALGVSDRVREVRGLLYLATPLTSDFLAEVAVGLDVSLEDLTRFEGKTIRDLYVEGVCGGAVVPLANAMGAPANVHVPLAHQSALAGILLGAQFVEELRRGPTSASRATRLNVMRPVPAILTQPLQKDARGICICQDPIYQAAFAAKYL
jgi:hypothetical protein